MDNVSNNFYYEKRLLKKCSIEHFLQYFTVFYTVIIITVYSTKTSYNLEVIGGLDSTGYLIRAKYC